jgi:pimeloyl-ACP methyl ester carboxylesterase/predicted Ser/Thr protein kinase
VRQTIRFCTAPDGVRLAYATSGAGFPIVKTGSWLTHLEYDWDSPIWRHLFTGLSKDHLLVRYDDRGNGLSDRDAADISFEAWVSDLETVVEAADLDRFALLGISRGGAVSIEYAYRHPERVTHLILLGAYSRGWSGRDSAKEAEIRKAMLTLMREGWGQDNPAFHQVWTSCFVPEGSLEHQRWFNELQRITTSPENAVRMQVASEHIDVTHRLRDLRVPTLVCHTRGDAVISFDHGRRNAAAIPGARFVPLDSKNHLLLEHEPAFDVFMTELHAFLGTEPQPQPAAAAATPPAATRLADTPLTPGCRLGQYEVVSRIGQGGMGIVYRAKDTNLGRDVALKVLSPSFATGERARRRLLREARHAAVVNHPNICTIFDSVEIDGRDVIVMELVAGVTLAALMGDGPLPTPRLCSIAAQIADALDHAHARGVIHGDLKAANVIVTENDRVKVLDFGVSRRLASDDQGPLTVAGSSEGHVGGTPAYMAPELLRGDVTDPRSDLWSLGVLLYELVIGRQPFAGRTLYDLMTDILETEPVVPVEADPRVAGVIGRCLRKDPSQRYQRGSEVRDALLAAARAAGAQQAI